MDSLVFDPNGVGTADTDVSWGKLPGWVPDKPGTTGDGGARSVGRVFVVVAGVVGLLVGCVVGGAAGWLVKPAPVAEKVEVAVPNAGGELRTDSLVFQVGAPLYYADATHDFVCFPFQVTNPGSEVVEVGAADMTVTGPGGGRLKLATDFIPDSTPVSVSVPGKATVPFRGCWVGKPRSGSSFMVGFGGESVEVLSPAG